MEKYQFSTNDNNINLLDKQDNATPKGKKIFKLSKFILYFFVVIIIAFLIFSSQVLFTGSSLNDGDSAFSFFKQLTNIAKGQDQLKGYDDDRINILLLGIGGAGHDGPYLSDTIIIASIQPSTNKVSMISVPRDLLVEIPEHGWWKINNVYHFGQVDDTTTGGAMASQVVSDITGLPIHYFMRVDFNGFEQFIDELGGVKVEVENSFTDYQYPTEDHEYQVISFDTGWQTMDGDTALKYVRSRHGNNGEGSDFARSKRQQKVIQAVKDRVLSVKTLLNFKKINSLLDTLSEHIETNMEVSEMLEFAKMSKDLDTDNIINVVLDNSTDGYLYSTMVNSAYVLRPKGEDFTAIQFMAQNIFASQHTISQKPSANLEIKNGTTIEGLAYGASVQLKHLGFKVLKIGNAPTQEYSQTYIYQLTDDTTDFVTESLIDSLDTQITTDVPEWVEADADFSTDYYIILGSDSEEKFK